MLPDLKRLGPRLGKQLPALKRRWSRPTRRNSWPMMETDGAVVFNLPDGLGLARRARSAGPLAGKAGLGRGTRLGRRRRAVDRADRRAVAEGHVRDLVHSIQNLRRDSGCEYTDRIELGIVTDSAELRKAITDFAEYVQSETLSIRISFEALPGVDPLEVKIAGHTAKI